MARTLKEEQGFPSEGLGAAIADKPQAASDVVNNRKKWLPLPLQEDGSPDTSKLPPPLISEKKRIRVLKDGTEYAVNDTKYTKPGEARYSVTRAGEVIAWYRKRGGVGRKLVFQFKKTIRDDEKGRKTRARDTAFRNLLRKNGVPGA